MTAQSLEVLIDIRCVYVCAPACILCFEMCIPHKWYNDGSNTCFSYLLSHLLTGEEEACEEADQRGGGREEALDEEVGQQDGYF